MMRYRLMVAMTLGAVVGASSGPRCYAVALLPGDVAVVAYNGSNSPDDIAFVALADLAAGQEIHFTDHGWKADNTFRANEGVRTFTVGAGGMSAGTIGSITGGGNFVLSTNGDQIIVFEGDVTTPNVIFALNFDAPGWVADATNSNNSALPPGVPDANIALIESHNARFDTTVLASGTKAQWLVAITNPSNWQLHDTVAFPVPTGSITVNATPPPGPPPGDPVINEFVANHVGTDTHEFVEIFGDPNADYSAFTILQLEGDGAGAGTIDTALRIGTTDANGIWVSSFLENELENGSMTLLLVEGFFGLEGDDVDTDNDGVIDNIKWDRIVDGVAVADGGAGDVFYAMVVLEPNFDGLPFTPGGASRIPNGLDTDSISDWVRNAFDGAGLPGFVGAPAAGEVVNTPGLPNPSPGLVPEPAAAMMMGAATLALALRRRRQ